MTRMSRAAKEEEEKSKARLLLATVAAAAAAAAAAVEEVAWARLPRCYCRSSSSRLVSQSPLSSSRAFGSAFRRAGGT